MEGQMGLISPRPVLLGTSHRTGLQSKRGLKQRHGRQKAGSLQPSWKFLTCAKQWGTQRYYQSLRCGRTLL